MKIISLLVVALLAVSLSLTGQNKVKVACVGNSITENRGIAEGKKYPDVLQSLLGNSFEVRNCGVSGRTLLKNGDHPYWNESKYGEVLSWLPDIVIIKLGTNDSKPKNWKYKNEFVSDYIDFIQSFKNLPSKPVIYVCLPVPVIIDKWGITENVVKNEVHPLVRKVARKTHLKLIDLYTPMVGKDSLFYDGVHPNAYGTKLMAETIYGVISKKAQKIERSRKSE